MATYAFPVLGFDPAPGDPDALASTGSACARLAADLADDAATLQGLGNAASWRGAAADAFTDRLGQLPQDLDRAQGSYGRVGSALAGYAATLREGQAQARRLEEQAAAAQATAVARAREADRLGTQLRDVAPPAAGAPAPNTTGTEAAQRAAQTRADAAAADHADAVRAARALLDRLQADGDQAAEPYATQPMRRTTNRGSSSGRCPRSTPGSMTTLTSCVRSPAG